MFRYLALGSGLCLLVASLQAQAPAAEGLRVTLDRYCVSCHHEKVKLAGLALDRVDLAHIADNAELWERVVVKLRGRVMPPAGRPRPDQAGYEGAIDHLEAELDRGFAERPNPGRPAMLHRLNRAEYRNAIRDLLGLAIDTGDLPDDAQSYGFDNIGDILGVSPVALERYLSSARRISRLAMGAPTIAPTSDVYVVPSDLTQRDRLDGLPFGTRGGTIIRANFPLDGSYDLRIGLARDNDANLLGLTEPHQIEVLVDDERVRLFTVGGKEGATEASVRIPVKAGAHAIGVAFLKRPAAQFEDLRQPFLRAVVEHGLTDGLPYIGKVTVAGPFDATARADTPWRQKILICRPTRAQAEAACARTIISAFARRAYRRPVTNADLAAPLLFYEKGRKAGGFEQGIEQALTRILVSPSFLFRIGRDPAHVAPGATYPVGDVELASRLSFFLWSSIPDVELLDLAERGRLADPVALDRQVRRMLADSRSQSLVTNFAGQWLYLRNVEGTRPDPLLFPDFDENLRRALRRETELFFESVVREPRSVLELLTADYTFVNERLARHYGIPNVYGDHFRRVAVDDAHRGGLLGHGSLLAVRSYATRTSPVLRGVWILENILGVPVPPPPPNVPDLRETAPSGKVLSMRERMVQHRANPACASCHAMMDPLGLALENFDAIGRWRTTGESNEPVDASGSLPDGTQFEGAAGLRRALASHSDAFVTTLTEKLLTYGLGRGLEHYDAPVIRQIVRDAAKDDYTFASLVSGIVKSVPFRMRRADQSEP